MTTAIETRRPVDLAKLEALADKARDFAQEAKSENTRRAYRSDWQGFVAWCDAQGLEALPADPGIVATYLADRAKPETGKGAKPSTLRRALTAINLAHKAAGYRRPSEDPRVAEVLKGILRRGGAEPNRKAPATPETIRAGLAGLDGLKGARDRALLLLGLATALRRSELAALTVEDLELTRAGLVVTVRRSKTNQAGRADRRPVGYGAHAETCPVAAIKGWLEAAGISEGPLFRAVDRHGNVAAGAMSDKAVALAVKGAAARAGEDPARFGGHSLRAGAATAARRNGARSEVIMKAGGWRSRAVMDGYLRETDMWSNPLTSYLGL